MFVFCLGFGLTCVSAVFIRFGFCFGCLCLCTCYCSPVLLFVSGACILSWFGLFVLVLLFCLRLCLG